MSISSTIFKSLFLSVSLFACFILSCKKEKINGPPPEIISMVFNHGALSTVNKSQKEVVVSLPDYVDRKGLIAIFQLSKGASATVNGVKQNSSETKNDFTQPLKYVISSENGSSEWIVRFESNNYRIGLGTEVQAENRLIKDYDWYVYDTHGPTSCLAMVLRWCHPLAFYGITAKDAILGKTDPGPFTSIDVFDILDYRQVPWKLVPVPATNDYSDFIECIDKGYPIIMNVDFRYVSFNQSEYQHTNRFWPITNNSLSGHYIVIKGYKKVDGNLFFEAYDPYSKGERYLEGGELKGYNRYYYAEYILEGARHGYGFNYLTVVGDKNNSATMKKLTHELNDEQIKFVSDKKNGLWRYGW